MNSLTGLAFVLVSQSPDDKNRGNPQRCTHVVVFFFVFRCRCNKAEYIFRKDDCIRSGIDEWTNWWQLYRKVCVCHEPDDIIKLSQRWQRCCSSRPLLILPVFSPVVWGKNALRLAPLFVTICRLQISTYFYRPNVLHHPWQPLLPRRVCAK